MFGYQHLRMFIDAIFNAYVKTLSCDLVYVFFPLSLYIYTYTGV